MLKILQANLQQYMNRELPDVQLDLEKVEEPEVKLPTSAGSWKKQESSRKTFTSLLTTPKTLTLFVWITTNCGKFFKRWEFQTTLPASCKICMQVKNQQFGFQIGKGVHQGCILSPCLFNFYVEYIMWNAWLDESQAGIHIARRNINNLRYADDTRLKAESEEKLKSLLKEESEKAGLKLNIQKTKIMVSGSITSWQIDG